MYESYDLITIVSVASTPLLVTFITYLTFRHLRVPQGYVYMPTACKLGNETSIYSYSIEACKEYCDAQDECLGFDVNYPAGSCVP